VRGLANQASTPGTESAEAAGEPAGHALGYSWKRISHEARLHHAATIRFAHTISVIGNASS